MKALIAGLIWLGSSYVFAQTPDPMDSIILESKTVAPGAHPGSATDTAAYVYLKVYITNKDTLTAVYAGFIETSLSGGAYLILARPRTFNGCVSRLTNTLNGSKIFEGGRYYSNSPDSIYIAGVFDPLDPSTHEPPNSVRKALWEIKFDTVLNNPGIVEVDPGGFAGHGTGFTNTVPRDMAVNIVKSIVTVIIPQKGDLNLDGGVSPADVVLELYCVFLGDTPPAGRNGCDVNCDGEITAADVTVFLNYKYITLMWPC